jgi:2-phosphosulfolactate phosphatase
MQQSVVIDCFPESVARYRKGYAVVAIDVIRATTMAISAVAAGWRCYAVPTLEAARSLQRKLDNPILAGELGGDIPAGFDMNNSPVDLAARTDSHRPLILLSSSGTQLIHESARCEAAYLACLRNYTAMTEYLVGRHRRIALIGAGSRGEFREEDEMCCAWIARGLMWHGYQAENASTRERINHWNNAPTAAGFVGHSVDYLRRTGQLRDLDFILGHLDDLNAIFSLREGQIAMIHGEKPVPSSAVLKHTSTAARVPNVTPDVEAVGQEVPEPRAQ